MKSITATLVLFAALAGGGPALAHKEHAAAVAPANANIDVDAQAAVDVVERFGKALAAGDFATVESLLDPDVLILESGGAERNRAEYMGHHAISDAQFLKGAHHQPGQRRARVSGDLAWVGSESELHASKGGKPITLLSTETMVLRRVDGAWRIVHIHWSSRPKT
jgi:ketosteroid isomerase-like protein